MASLISPCDCDPRTYQGVDEIFEYTNSDGLHYATCCGQAAAATFLTHHQRLKPETGRAEEIMALLETKFPQDQLGGRCGTGRRQVERICHAHGIGLREIRCEKQLRLSLDANNPVIVMLGVSAGSFHGFSLPGGHWMVAYGYDRGHIYLSNHGRMTWRQFHQGWNALVPHLIRMHRRGLAATVVSPDPG